jgi:hypothetical protein
MINLEVQKRGKMGAKGKRHYCIGKL